MAVPEHAGLGRRRQGPKVASPLAIAVTSGTFRMKAPGKAMSTEEF